jgi:Tol biopolymer transport system component
MNGETEMLFGATQAAQPPVLSGDGNHVAFQTCDPWMRQDHQPICDVLIVDITTSRFVNGSTTPDGMESTDASDEPVLSPTGRFLVFRTNSGTLIPAGAAPGQIVLRDRDANGDGVFDQTGGVSLEVVSVSSAGEAANGPSESAEVSADGRFVLFRSLASNLVPGDTNNAWDVFLRDRQTGETRRINVGWGGQEATPYLDSPAISMSADGTLIAFATDDDYLTNRHRRARYDNEPDNAGGYRPLRRTGQRSHLLADVQRGRALPVADVDLRERHQFPRRPGGPRSPVRVRPRNPGDEAGERGARRH